jgi:predicted TIM-barrel fold metal-dependent hydrolase
VSTPLVEYARSGRRVDAFPIFDAHAHVYSAADPSAPSIAERLVRMDRLGIVRCAVSSSVAIGAEFEEGNDDVAEVVRVHPDRFIGYCHVSANYADGALAELKRCFGTGLFKGIKVYQTGTAFDDPRFDAVWEFAVAHRTPVLAHTWGGALTGFDTAAAKHPEIAFLAGHAGSGFAYQAYIDAAKRVPNLYLDLTYSREHTNMIETMVRAVGADRVVWGTDEPLFSMEHQLGKVLFADIPDEDKRKILSTNAARLFR